MKKVISLIACFFIAIFAQQEQYPWQKQQAPQQQQQLPQGQYQDPPQQQQCECNCPKQREYKYQYQYQYQYPPQQEQYQQQQQQVVNMDKSMEKRREVQKLIEDGIEKNKYEIQSLSVHLSNEDMEVLYEENKMNAIGYAALSGTIGFGLGSYIQGNTTFGIVQSILDVTNTILLLTDNQALSVFTMSISRVAGLIAPFVYQNSYNKTLKATLHGYSLSYSIDPLIVPKEGTPAVGLAFNLRY